MPTVLSHPEVPLALTAIAGTSRISGRLLLAGVVASALPDLDVLGFRLGIAYSSEFGHRGFSHSLLFAAVVAAFAALSAPALKAQRFAAAWFVGLACASHGVLDMLTNGGHGIAYFWPISDDRFFFPTQVIEASTLNLRRFLGPAGFAVLVSEFRWVWLPAIAVAIVGAGIRRRVAASQVAPRKRMI